MYLEIEGSTVGKNLSVSYNTQHVLRSAHLQGSEVTLLVTGITKNRVVITQTQNLVQYKLI